MSLQSQVLTFIGGFVLCLGIMIPLMLKWNDAGTAPTVSSDAGQPLHAPKPPNQFHKPAMEHPKIQKQAKKSWIAYLAPVYAFAICAYVLFMVYRITTKQRQKANNLTGRRPFSSRLHKPLLTQDEMGVLQNRLSASEKAVDEILQKARHVMTEVYKKEMDDNESTLSESSDIPESSDDERCSPKIIELVTTSSANNDTHQDSTDSEERIQFHHHRKTRHKIKTHLVEESDEDSSSSEEVESGICHAEISDLRVIRDLAPPCEEVSTNHESDFPSDDSMDNSSIPSNYPMNESSKGDNPEKVPETNTPALVKSVNDFENVAENIGETIENHVEKKKFFNEKKQLLNTTKEVINAMGEIREFMKDQNSGVVDT